MGVDVSAEAVESARAAFGDHFAVAGAPPVAAGAPYDVIYHVGMIGCVADPLGLTKSLLTILKPGGRLLFNAPNRDSCYLRGQLWLDSAPPPDLVTLFPPGFWPRQFESVAEVRERAESWPVERSVEIGLRKVFGRRWRKPVPVPLANARERTAGTGYSPARLWRKFEQVVAKAGRITGLSRLAPKQPSEFGLYVSMTKRGEIAN
jgi:SAM-dependent methyltransferase